jgi:F-type H+-transporting ATPase subunit b
MVIVLLIFFFLIYQLNTKLYRPLIRFMDNREETIAKDLEAARNLSSDSDELRAKAQANLDAARSEAARMRQEAIEKVKTANAEAAERKQRELEEKYQQFRVQLEEERESLKSTVLSQLPLIKESLKAKFSQI